MLNTEIVYIDKTKSGKEIIFRYPTFNDVEIMKNYINTLSLEKTFITFQGEQLSFEDEKVYLESCLKKIINNKKIILLGFIDNKLIACSDVELEERVRSHVGVFGISVAKEYRGDGVGKLIMKNALNEASKIKGLKIIILEVYSLNTLAQNLYKQFGFQEYGRLNKAIKYKDEYIDSILMSKNLQSSPVKGRCPKGGGVLNVKGDVPR